MLGDSGMSPVICLRLINGETGMLNRPGCADPEVSFAVRRVALPAREGKRVSRQLEKNYCGSIWPSEATRVRC